MSNSHGQQPPTDPDPVFQFTGDLLERYEGLEVDDLKVCAKKYQKDNDDKAMNDFLLEALNK